MSVVHFIIHSGGMFGKFLKLLETSIDTNQCIFVLLATIFGYIMPRGSGAVEVIVTSTVHGSPRYTLANRLYSAI